MPLSGCRLATSAGILCSVSNLCCNGDPCVSLGATLCKVAQHVLDVRFVLCQRGRMSSVQGEAIERFAQMTNWDYYEAAKRFQKVLEASGINAALVARHIQDGDSVVIGEMEMEWSHDQVRPAT